MTMIKRPGVFTYLEIIITIIKLVHMHRNEEYNGKELQSKDH